jgi:chromosome segregation ATPase
MSSSSNGEQPDQELERLRQLNRQYQKQVSETAQLNTELQLKVDELEPEQNRLLMLQSPFSPNIIQNLQDSLHDMQMEQLFMTFSPASKKRLLRWETKFIQRLERRFPKSKRQQQQPNQELERLRELNRQYQQQVSQTAQLNRELQQKVDELEVELQGRSPLQSPLSSLQKLQQEFDRMDNIIGQFRQKKMEAKPSKR